MQAVNFETTSKIDPKTGELEIVCSGDLTILSNSKITSIMKNVMMIPNKIIINLIDVTSIDIGGYGILLYLKKQYPQKIVLTNARPKVSQLLQRWELDH